MGLPWFAVYADFPDHPKSIRLGAKLGNPLAWAHVLKLWAYCARLAMDGRVEADIVEHAAGWSGRPGRFVEAAEACGFIERQGDAYLVHGWEERNGAHVRKHERDARKPRGNRHPAAPVPPPSRAGPERDESGTGAGPAGEKEKESKKEASLPSAPAPAWDDVQGQAKPMAMAEPGPSAEQVARDTARACGAEDRRRALHDGDLDARNPKTAELLRWLVEREPLCVLSHAAKATTRAAAEAGCAKGPLEVIGERVLSAWRASPRGSVGFYLHEISPEVGRMARGRPPDPTRGMAPMGTDFTSTPF